MVQLHNEIVSKHLVIKRLLHIMKVSQNIKVTERTVKKQKPSLKVQSLNV